MKSQLLKVILIDLGQPDERGCRWQVSIDNDHARGKTPGEAFERLIAYRLAKELPK